MTLKYQQRYFRIKGSYYYSAQLADELGLLLQNTPLTLVPEPNNHQDKRAIQIWLTHFPCWLLGYVPRRKTRLIHFLLNHNLMIHTKLHSVTPTDDRLILHFYITYTLPWYLLLAYWLRVPLPSKSKT